jgi:hypothetical protein
VRMLHETEVPQARETLPHAAGGWSHRGKEAL